MLAGRLAGIVDVPWTCVRALHSRLGHSNVHSVQADLIPLARDALPPFSAFAAAAYGTGRPRDTIPVQQPMTGASEYIALNQLGGS